MKRYIGSALAALAFLALVPAVSGQTPQEPGITRQQADDILNELREIRRLLENGGGPGQQAQAKPQAPRAKLNLKGAQMMGSANAPVTLVEFTDFQCPFCQSFHVTTFSELKREFIDTGKVRFYSRDLPLDFHKDAMRAAQAGRCAADQKKFWDLRSIMAANPDKLDMASLLAAADKLKLDVAAFKSCIESDKYKNAVQTDLMDGLRLGIGGTPSFVLGKSTADGVDGEIVEGALPVAMFSAKITSLLQ
jgi:protein-disulfide isomerase